MPRPLSTHGKDPVTIVQEAGWTPGSICTGAENLTPTEIRSPGRPALSLSLYQLSYAAHGMYVYSTNAALWKSPHSAIYRLIKLQMKS
jgi:hypothetical protein